MRASDIKVGNKYWWNDPDEGVASNCVTVVSVSGEGGDAVVVCKFDTDGVVYALPCELEEIKSDNGNNKVSYYGQPWMYTMLGISRDKFRKLIYEELVEGVATEYANVIAERIADGVAQDICDTADHKNWNDCDARLGIGRVLLKAVGGDA